ncbi:MAG: arginine--tRNA ligase [Patescibacteria group bacterium]
MKTLKIQLEEILNKQVTKLWPLSLPKVKIEVERPKEERFGDYSSSLAMQLAPLLEKNSMEIGHQLIKGAVWPKAINKAMIVAPGFINFYLSADWLRRQASLNLKNKKFGQLQAGKGQKIQVEFVSANPTGPLHLGNGRGAFTGDTLARVLTAAGYKVRREYYINDMGNQIETLAESVRIRFFQQQGIKLDYPDNCYKGEYVSDLARKLKSVNNYKLKNIGQVREKIKSRVLKLMLEDIEKLLAKRLKIKYDRWFYESELYGKGLPEKVMALLKEKKLLYRQDEAIFLKTTLYGDDKDRVLVKKDGEPTYFLSDIAYHYDKLSVRKFDRVIDIWGADHHGYQGRMQAALRALGFENKLDIIIYQLVKLKKDGVEVKMSKRAGTFVTLDELIDDVGSDVARFFFLMYAAGTHMDFDLNLAKEKSEKNPVYYVQYAHARICSIIKKAAKMLRNKKIFDPEKLNKKEELDLVKEILKLPELIEEISRSYEVHKLSFYAQNLAIKFHDFYNVCRVIDNGKLKIRRFELIKLTKFALMKVLALMGISAPERM